MFTLIVGSPIDPVTAGLALAVMFITLCIFATCFIAVRKSKTQLQLQFDIDKIKLRDEDAEKKRQNDRHLQTDLVKLATDKDIQYRRIETGMIEATANKSNYDKDC